MTSFKWPVKLGIIVIGVLICAYILWPNVTIIPGGNNTNTDPFITTLTFQNNSVYPIYKVKTECIIIDILDNNYKLFRNLTSKIDIGYVEKLHQMERRPISLRITIKGLDKGLAMAHVKFLIYYELPLIGLNLSKSVSLVVERSSVNLYKWSEM